MVVTAVGGIPEIFPAGSPALVMPRAEALAVAMGQALDDPDGFAMLMPTQQSLRERFGADVMAARITEAYRGALV